MRLYYYYQKKKIIKGTLKKKSYDKIKPIRLQSWKEGCDKCPKKVQK